MRRLWMPPATSLAWLRIIPFGVARQHAGPARRRASQTTQIQAAEPFQQVQQQCVPPPEDRLPRPPLAPDLLHQRLDLDLQGRAGEIPSGVTEGRPRCFAQVVQAAVEQVDVLSS